MTDPFIEVMFFCRRGHLSQSTVQMRNERAAYGIRASSNHHKIHGYGTRKPQIHNSKNDIPILHTSIKKQEIGMKRPNSRSMVFVLTTAICERRGWNVSMSAGSVIYALTHTGCSFHGQRWSKTEAGTTHRRKHWRQKECSEDIFLQGDGMWVLLLLNKFGWERPTW